MTYRFGHLQGVGDESFDSIYDSLRSDIEQRNTALALHDPESADIKMARQLANEMINVSGAEVKIFIRTENADYDQVWDEDPDPTYWTPILMKGFFKPSAVESELNKWGVDTINKTDIVFSHHQLYMNLGERMLRTGDVIQIPFNSIPISLKNYRILNGSPTGNFRYNWLYFTCQIELLTADITVRPDDDMPSENVYESGGQYRESL